MRKGRGLPSLRRGRACATVAGLVAFLVAAGAGAPGCKRDGEARLERGQPAVSAAASSDRSGPAAQDANARLDWLVGENLSAELKAAPTAGTCVGVHLYDDRLDDVRLDELAREAARLRSFLERLRQLPSAGLDAAHRLDRDLFEQHLQWRIFEQVELRQSDRNPMPYAQIVASGVDCLLDGEPDGLPDRLRVLAARLRRVRPFLEEARRNLRGSQELAVRRAADVLTGTKGFVSDALGKLGRTMGDPKQQEELRLSAADAARAIDDFVGWMQRELVSRSRPALELAIGRERLFERLRLAEGVAVAPEWLVALAERDRRDLRRRIDETQRALAAIRQVEPGKVDWSRLIEEDHGRADELLRDAQATLDALAQAPSARLFSHPALPRVAEMPPERWGFLRLDAAGLLDPRPRMATVWIDPVDASWPERRRSEHLRALNRAALTYGLMREVLPGRYLKLEAARRAPTTMQKTAGGLAVEEGWPLYAVQAWLDASAAETFDELKLRFVAERDLLLKTARLEATVRYHALGAKTDDLVGLLTDALGDEYLARREVERVVLDGWALAPALGRLAILKLRDDLKALRGEGFDLQAFHGEVLGHGTVPIGALRRILGVDEGATPL